MRPVARSDRFKVTVITGQWARDGRASSFIRPDGSAHLRRAPGDLLDKDKTTLRINESLNLANIPPQAFEYRLGNRSALEWVIDQYQVSEDKQSGITSDPNRPDDEEYIVRLVGQVVRVSVETVRIVAELSATVSLP